MIWPIVIACGNAVVQGLVLTAVVAAALALVRPRRAAVRYGVWCLLALVLAGLPVADALHPRTVASGTRPAHALGIAGLRHLAVAEPVAFRRRIVQDAAHLATPLASRFAQPIAIAWAVIAGALLARLAAASFALARLRRRSRPWLQTTGTVNVRGRRRVAFALSDDIDTACALGPFRPTILVPAADVERLDRADLARIVAHEYAHLQRYDDWMKLLQRLVSAVFFFQPALAYVQRRIDRERELACDDVVLEATGDPVAYAECLAQAAERGARRRVDLAPAFTIGGSQVYARVAHILDERRDSRAGLTRSGAVLCIAVTAAAFVVVPLQIPHASAASATPSYDWHVWAAHASDDSPLFAEERSALADAGISRSDLAALGDTRFSTGDLIQLHNQGVPFAFVHAIAQALPYADADDVATLSDTGVSAAAIAALVRAQGTALSTEDLVNLIRAGVDASFIEHLADHGYRAIPADKLIALKQSGFNP
jgi:beta-lactamase regulating signal transducer with metallopeptidase domain